MQPADDLAIRAAGIGKRYRSGDDKLVVLDDLNLEVRRGERLAVIGVSGAGKSTLLHLLGGLDRPTAGTIHIGSREITSLDDSELARLRNQSIGFVWQMHCLLPEFTAIENVMMPLLIRGVSHAAAAAAAMALLEEVGLRARASHRAGELSGGEQQRVVLARALVGKPAFLFADEPTGNLDTRTGGMIMELLDELHRAHGLTTIYVTHNLSFAQRCDRTLRLEGGALIPCSLEDGKAYV